MRAAIFFVFLATFTQGAIAQNALPNARPPYSPQPPDNYWEKLFQFDNRAPNGEKSGADLNVRGAWGRTKGEGVIIAIATDGVDLGHRDLATNQVAEFHYDFERNVTNGVPTDSSQNYGTAEIGQTVAAWNDQGIVGVAPAAKFAVWKIHRTNAAPFRSFIDPDKMAKTFVYHTNEIAVQLHNWLEPTIRYGLVPMSEVESQAISNAVNFGRGGKGVVIVRPGGDMNLPDFKGNNENAYTSDPRVIAVGSARGDGRVSTFSERGAAVLVTGVTADPAENFPNIFTTDRTGPQGGLNIITFPTEPMLSDYTYWSISYSSTTLAAAQLAGVCALILSANPNLTYRDVQQILIHASRQMDKADPDLKRNGAGYWVSHKQGFGIVDAGEAVRLADSWKNRPAMARRVINSDLTGSLAIPDAGLRLYLSDLTTEPPFSRSFPAFPSMGLHTDNPTAELPLVYIEKPFEPISQDLTGKGAVFFDEVPAYFLSPQLDHVIAAGAEFAVVYNQDDPGPMLYNWLSKWVEFKTIPVVLVPTEAGPLLTNYISSMPGLRAQIRATPAVARFGVDEAMLCEHVGVRVRTSHVSRQDLRFTLVSPQGHRSVLQTINGDQTAGPVDWTYYSVQHFYELSSGVWTLEVTDEVQGLTGDLLEAQLIIHGVPILDLDDDGLDDTWELANFLNLDQGGLDDPDGDGSWNAREQVLGTNPKVNQVEFKLVTSQVQSNAVRVAFPSVEGRNYLIRSGTDLNLPLQNASTVPGNLGETEITTPLSEARRFFQIREEP